MVQWKKWYGTHSYTPDGKWDFTATQRMKRFEESGHPVFKSISALSSGILKRNKRDTSMRMQRTQNSDFTQLRNNGAVACGCQDSSLKPDETSEKLTKTENDQILKEVGPHDVKMLVQNSKERRARIWKQTARMHSEFWDIGEIYPIYNNFWECDILPESFFRMCYKTVPDVEDGFGDPTPACRECTHLAWTLIPIFMPTMDARRGAWKCGMGTIVIRWQEDEKYRNSQQPHGWTEEYGRYLDYLATIDISYSAPSHQRHRYESTLNLVCHDEDRQAGPMKAWKDSEPTTKIVTCLRQEQGRQNSSIPKNERRRQRPFDE